MLAASDTTIPANPPLVSLFVAARNDDYMGDFKWRLSTACNYMAQSLAKIGRLGAVELLVGDWNSDVPLHKEIKLTPEARDMVRFIVIPPAIAATRQQDSKFPNCIVYNACTRRAWGTFIGQTNADVLYPPATLYSLLGVLEERLPVAPVRKCLMVAARRQMAVSQVQRQPTLREVDEYVNRNAGLFPQEGQHVANAAPTELMLMHRDLWEECGGKDERFIYVGWVDVDLALRMTQRYPLVHLNNYGVNLIHMEHFTEQRDYDPKKFFRRINKSDDTPKFQLKNENWGLANHKLEWARAENVAPASEPSPLKPGEVEVWTKTPPDIESELRNSTVIDLFRQTGEACPGLVKQHEINAMLAVAWYAIWKRPRTYLEVGLRYPPAAAMVARAVPGVELYALVDWERNRADESMFSEREDACFTFLNSNITRGYGHQWAYARFVGGDPATALERLAGSSFGAFRVDLAVVRADAPHAVDQAVGLVNYLTPGGGIVVSATEPAKYQSVINAIRERYPHFFVFTFSDNRNGMVLAAQLGTPSTAQTGS